MTKRYYIKDGEFYYVGHSMWSLVRDDVAGWFIDLKTAKAIAETLRSVAPFRVGRLGANARVVSVRKK